MSRIPPFHSQYRELPEEWRHRGCGLVALYSVLEYWEKERGRSALPTLPDLLEEGIEDGAYIDGIGWSHVGLASLARRNGYEAWNRDLPKESPELAPDEAFGLLAVDISRGPVLASVWKNYDPEEKGGHIVIVYDTRGDQVMVLDPEATSESAAYGIVDRARFLRGWKRRYICALPLSSL